MRHRLVLLALLCIPATQAVGQDGLHFAEVTVVGVGQVDLDPDYAVLSISVRTQEETPVEAAASMSQRIDRVLDVLVDAGISRDSIPALYLAINATRDQMDYTRIKGYTAQTTLEATTTQLERIAEFLSAALEAGATDVGRIRFGSTKVEGAKQEALRLAVEAAETDAQTIASVRGAQLGRLFEISTVPPASRSMDSSFALNEIVVTSGSTTPRQVSVRASVTAKWVLH